MFSVAEGVVVLDFWATWCPPCVALTPVIDQLDYDNKGKIVVGKVNTEENPEAATAFNITSIPCVVFLEDGVEVERLMGLRKKEEFQSVIDSLIGEEEADDQ